MSAEASSNELKTAARLDKLAVLLSGVCILHCLLAPVLITLLPIFSMNAILEDVLFHKLMLWLVLPTSSVALLIGCRKHRDGLILCTGLLGMVMLVAVAFLGHDILSPTVEKITTSIAGLILAYSHFLNYRACQKITCSDSDCSSAHHH